MEIGSRMNRRGLSEEEAKKTEPEGTSPLAIGGFRAVFSLVMVFGNVHWNFRFGQPGRVGGGKIRAKSEQDGAEGEAGNVFQNIGILHGRRY